MTLVCQLLHWAFFSNRLHVFLCTQWLWKTFPSAEHGWAPSHSNMYSLLLPSSVLMLLGINWSLKPWFKLRDRLQWEKVVWVISWGYSEGRGILRKLHPSVSFLVMDGFHRNFYLWLFFYFLWEWWACRNDYPILKMEVWVKKDGGGCKGSM